LWEILSAEEQARAGRLHFDQDRERFIMAHGLLRLILSGYLSTVPRELRFSYSPHGKPALTASSDQETPNFNLAHSGRLALYAISRGRRIGIDVERIRSDCPCELIAEQFFSPQERAVLRALEAEEVKRRAFFNGWTRKEAYIKARGEGLSFPLDQFDVSLVPGEPVALRRIQGTSLEASRWSLHELFAGPDYVAALAVEGHNCRLACWEWQE
jgi:4'-phosphopantetheinyl transferase